MKNSCANPWPPNPAQWIWFRKSESRGRYCCCCLISLSYDCPFALPRLKQNVVFRDKKFGKAKTGFPHSLTRRSPCDSTFLFSFVSCRRVRFLITFLSSHNDGNGPGSREQFSLRHCLSFSLPLVTIWSNWTVVLAFLLKFSMEIYRIYASWHRGSVDAPLTLGAWWRETICLYRAQ